MSESLVRIGVTGSGFMGRTHVEAARRAPGAEIVAVAGGRRAPGLADDYGIDCVETVEDLIRRDDIDHIIVHGFKQCLSISRVFHRWITLDQILFGGVVLIREPQVMNARFRCDGL